MGGRRHPPRRHAPRKPRPRRRPPRPSPPQKHRPPPLRPHPRPPRPRSRDHLPRRHHPPPHRPPHSRRLLVPPHRPRRPPRRPPGHRPPHPHRTPHRRRVAPPPHPRHRGPTRRSRREVAPLARPPPLPGGLRHPRRRTPASLLDFATDAAEVYEDAKAHGQTPFVLLATAWLRALHEVTGEERIVIGTPYHHRDDWRFAGTVGCLVDMVPLLSDFRADPQDLRARTAQEVRAAQRSAAVPFARLVRELEPPRHGQNPLFQAILTFQQSADGLLGDGFAIPWSQAHQTLDGVEVRAVDVPPRDTAFAVSLYGARDGDRLVFRLEHQEHLVPATTAARLRDAFRAALAELTAPLARTGTTGG
ncbi:hypothetical protein F3K43_39310 [Streptomyces sp. LBUM 1476]|nr:hypothetical protein [Streptomyces sp. LBUM 1476]